MYTNKTKWDFSFAILLLVLIVLAPACKNENNDKKVVPETNVQSKTTNPDSVTANLISTFRQYKLERSVLEGLSKAPHNAKKIVLKISLDDLKDPSIMSLWLYPAKDHKDYAQGKTKIEILPSGAAVVFTDTKDIVIGNNELTFKKLKNGGEHKDPWEDFDYLMLTPTRNGDNLAFKIQAYKNGKAVSLGIIPAETNPSPPAKPEDD